MGSEELKALVIDGVEAQRDKLVELGLRIYSNPETGHQEEKACAWLSEYLRQNGFEVQPGFCGMATAFKASYGRGKPTIAILAEYDALPGVGHGCGHNLIGASSAGAGVAARAVVDRLGGCLVVLGTPAEEMIQGPGGKVLLVGRGGLEGVDVAMMVHPGVQDRVNQRSLACEALEVEFFGKPAHAAFRPEQGVNALDALLLAFQGINALRQHMSPQARIHGVITRGGEAANVVPIHTAGQFYVRAVDRDALAGLKERVIECFRGAAIATGARLEYRWVEGYAPMRSNRTLAEVFAHNAQALGRPMRLNPTQPMGSTDMGNVSQVVPSVHPILAIAPLETPIHNEAFAQASSSPAGLEGMVLGAKALAMTVVDLLASPELLTKVREEFQQGQGQ